MKRQLVASTIAIVLGLLVAAMLPGAVATAADVPLGLPAVEHPKDNLPTPEKIALGKQLFFDGRVSRDNKISCASCHDPAKGFSNGEQFATGFEGKKGGRNSPTIINSAYNRYQFWDGREPSLEAQAVGPIGNPIEMSMTLPEVVAKLNKVEGYRTQFKAVFDSEVTAENIGKAIAAYERTILCGDAPYDRFKAGDKKAMSEAAQRGMALFFGKANCESCHSGSNFTDNSFHNIGVGMKAKELDVGRQKISTIAGDRGSFKTPTVRDIVRTAPYMHDGSLKTLEEVVAHYAKGGETNEHLDEDIYELKISDQDKADLVTFMKEGLTSAKYPDEKPPKLPE